MNREESRIRAYARRAAFTLVEVLVIISIVLLLLSLLLPAVQAARGAARRVHCANNFRQVALGLALHHDVHKRFPPATDSIMGSRRWQGWPAKLLPFVEQQALAETIASDYSRSNDPFDSVTHPGLSKPLSNFACVEDSRTLSTQISRIHGYPVGCMAMQGNSGRSGSLGDGVLFYDSRIRYADVLDGTSQTLLFGERPPSVGVDYGWWYAGAGSWGGTLDHHIGAVESSRTRYGVCTKPTLRFQQGSIHDECSASHFWSLHWGGAHFARVDGSVQFMSYNAVELIELLATRAGQEILNAPY